ncbi:MAG: FecR domain-containing protein [Bacillota bacterium]
MTRVAGVLAALLATAALSSFAQSQAPSQPARNPAGKVVLIDGNARIAPVNGDPRALKVGDVVSEGDAVFSGKDGEVHLQMQDSGFMVLRPNTRIVIESYRADGGDEDKGVFKLLVGGLRSVTGWIGKFNQRAYVIKTQGATIGIRGTDHETRYIPEGSSEGEPGTYDVVYAGETVIESSGGKASVTPNKAGYASGKARPRLLASIPVIFKPGPHEAELQQKHAEIQKVINERREERRKVIREKAAELAAARASVRQTLEQRKAAGRPMRLLSPADQRALNEKRAALQHDSEATKALGEEIQADRKSLSEDFKASRLTRGELAQRRKALREKEEQLEAQQASLQERRKALQEETDAKIDERFSKRPGQKKLYDEVLDARAKRDALEAERQDAAKEMKTMQREENKRYGD